MTDRRKELAWLLGKTLLDALELTQEKETAAPWALGLKLAEETGEFSEAMLKELGYLQHKELKEPMTGEAADIFNVVIAALANTYPEKSFEDIVFDLVFHMKRKTQKYRDILEAQHG